MTIEISHAPRTGARTDGPERTTPAQLSAAVDAAVAAAPAVSAASPEDRSRWLNAIAGALDEHRTELVGLADEETALGGERLSGEAARAAVNIRYYASAGRSGDWMQATLQRLPDAGLDLRRARLPIGPVAVFGASNFPFQFSVLGHDTASAIAAGCPVVVKAHPAHPRLSVALAELAGRALADAGAPDGTLSLVIGFEAGRDLVQASGIAAVAFTGSQRGGLALVEQARRRPQPIPVFAEMGTVNPVVVTPAAAAGRPAAIADEFVASFTLGAGQFCTKPGLLLTPSGGQVADLVIAGAGATSGVWLLTGAIADGYRDGIDDLAAAGGEIVATGDVPDGGYAARPTVLRVDVNALQPGSRLLDECFGPVALIAEYDDLPQALAVLDRMQPSLAGAVYSAGPDDPDVPAAVARLAGKVGRVVVDGAPTGVATVDAMQHGGPWPATSEPGATSVGAEALVRFTRPVAFQNIPDAALPAALRDGNPWTIRRREIGEPR